MEPDSCGLATLTETVEEGVGAKGGGVSPSSGCD